MDEIGCLIGWRGLNEGDLSLFKAKTGLEDGLWVQDDAKMRVKCRLKVGDVKLRIVNLFCMLSWVAHMVCCGWYLTAALQTSVPQLALQPLQDLI